MLIRRIDANRRGRDFVVGDVHGCFRTLEALLEEVSFRPGRDRLFSVGDLINRGPHSLEAMDWLVERRIDDSAMGNHENALVAFLMGRSAGVYEPWWRTLDDRDLWIRTIRAMPLAITVETRCGDVGIIHAGPIYRDWLRTVEDLELRHDEAVQTALLGGYEGAGATWRGKRATEVKGVRAIVTGHHPRKDVGRDGTWWQIDTGAGTPGGRLSLVQVDCDPIVATTLDVVASEEVRPVPTSAQQPRP